MEKLQELIKSAEVNCGVKTPVYLLEKPETAIMYFGGLLNLSKSEHSQNRLLQKLEAFNEEFQKLINNDTSNYCENNAYKIGKKA